MQGHTYRRRKPDGSWSRWHAVIDLPAVVEAAGVVPCGHADQHAGADHDIHLADEVALGPRRVLPPAVGCAPAVAVDSAAGLLHRAVGVQQLRADDAHARVAVRKPDQRREPVGVHAGVVVQE